MSSSSSSIIEHVVLLNIKEEEEEEEEAAAEVEEEVEEEVEVEVDPSSSRVDAMVNALNSLNSLEEVAYLTAGPILRTRSSPVKLTHMLHARFRSKSDLSHYMESLAHVSVVEELVRPICQNVITVDWEVEGGLDGPLVPRPGSALRLTLFKSSDADADAEDSSYKKTVMEGLRRIKEKSGGPFEQITYGENFNRDRGCNYSLGSLVVFPDSNELDASEEYEDQMRSLVDKAVKHNSLDHHALIALDYLVPRHPPPR